MRIDIIEVRDPDSDCERTNCTADWRPDMNENCLAGMACPDCGNDERLLITITTTAYVTDNGSEVDGDHTWNDDSNCACPNCDYVGTVRDFKEA